MENSTVLIDNIIVYMNMLANWLQVSCLVWLVYMMNRVQKNQRAEILLERMASAAEQLIRVQQVNDTVDRMVEPRGKITGE